MSRTRRPSPVAVLAAGLAGTLAAALLATTALADPPITTRPGDAPPSAPEPAASPIDDGAAGPPAAERDADAGPRRIGRPGACAPPEDRSPHGEVWAGASSRGYGDVGGVVTGPLGSCGDATLAIDVGGRR